MCRPTTKTITIFALSWRDIESRAHGGAEVLTHRLLAAAVQEGIHIIHMAPFEEGLEPVKVIDGVEYRREGSTASVIKRARRYYRDHRDEIDFVIDQCNTFRFFTKFWVPREKRIFFIHQLTREIWDINLKFPFSKIGRMMETPMLRLNRKDRVAITVSESTKNDLVNVGFPEDRVKLIFNGLEDEMRNLPIDFTREKKPNFIYVGRYSKYKGINTSIEALALVKEKNSQAKLWIVGKKDEKYLEEELRPLCASLHLSIGDDMDKDVVTFGYVSEEKKHALQQEAKALVFPSLREGWGIIINEAGALGTPSITYDAPGTRDAVDFGNAGYLCENRTKEVIAEKMLRTLEEPAEYMEKCKKAYAFANQFTYEKSGKQFVELVQSLL